MIKKKKIVGILISDCREPPLPPVNGELLGVNQTKDSAGTYPVGAIATYQCLFNFLAEGNTSLSCLETGLWEAVTFTCMQGTNKAA